MTDICGDVGTDGRKLTLSLLTDFLEKAQGGGASEGRVIDAFDIPLYQYDDIRKMFHKRTEPRSVIANVAVSALCCNGVVLVQTNSFAIMTCRVKLKCTLIDIC